MHDPLNFVRNGWYVGAFSDAVTDKPIRRVMLGEPVVLFRTAAGGVIALADRCPHRFAPLSMGKVKGDVIQCPYHGLEFGSHGACVFNPHGDHKIPKAAKVRSYPVAERDQLIWVWMGAPEMAAQSPPPDFSEFFGHGSMTLIADDYIVSAHCETVLDNLLDLSHAPYLHPTTLADADSIDTLRKEMKQEGNTVWAYHYAPRTTATPQFKPAWPVDQPLIDFHAHMRWDAPANLQLDVGITALGRPESEGIYLHMVHLLTPIDMNHTRYTWIAARNFAIGIEEVSRLMHAQVQQAFTTEDEPMIHAVWEAMDSADLFELSPVLLPGDAAGVRARRILKQLRDNEALASAQSDALA